MDTRANSFILRNGRFKKVRNYGVYNKSREMARRVRQREKIRERLSS